jgi:hypothetical protein
MGEKQMREEFDTGIGKIRHEIKSRLVPHGLYGSVTNVDTASVSAPISVPVAVPDGSTIEIIVKGRSVARSFNREDIENCCLRVRGPVLLGIISMIEEVSA